MVLGSEVGELLGEAFEPALGAALVLDALGVSLNDAGHPSRKGAGIGVR
jgi:hypothetical protein